MGTKLEAQAVDDRAFGFKLFLVILGITMGASTFLLSVTWRFFYSFSNVEWIEKLLAPVAFLLAFVVALFLVLLRRYHASLIVALLTWTSLAIVLFELTTQGQPTPTDFNYRPFSILILLLSFIIGTFLIFFNILLFHALKSTSARRFAVASLSAGSLAAIAFKFSGALGWNFHHADAVPIFDELYATVIGRDSFFNYAPLYQSLFGYPYRLFLSLDFDPVTTSLWYIVFLQAICLGIVTFLLFRLVAPTYWWISILIFFGLTFSSPFEELTIGDFWSNLPFRFFWPVVTALFLYLTLASKSVAHRRFFLVLAAASACIASINNFEFGIPVLVALVMCVSVYQIDVRDFKLWLILAVVPLGVFGTYLLVAWQRGSPFDLGLYLGYAIGYQNIPWMAINMPTRGFHLLYLGLPVASLIYFLWVWQKKLSPPATAFVASFFCLVGLASFVYFAGRSALTATIALTFYLAVIMAILVPALLENLLKVWSRLSFANRFLAGVVPSLVIGSAVLALFLGTPNRAPELPTGASFDRWYWLGDPTSVARSLSSAVVQLGANSNEVAVVIPNSTYVADLAGLSNTMLTPQPFHLSQIPTLAQRQCELWRQNGVRFVLGEEPPPCAHPVSVPLDSSWRAFQLHIR